MMRLTVSALLLTPAVDAAVLRGLTVNEQQMRPEVVAMTLVHVEDDWKAEAGIFTMEGDVKAEAAFEKSCKTVVAAVVQGSGGDRAVAKEYMSNVCNQKQLAGWRQNHCADLSNGLQSAMSVDSYSNRENLNAGKLCTGLWSKFVGEERKREEQEAQERAAHEKIEAEEAVKAKAKAEADAKVEAERRAVEEARHAKDEKEQKAAAEVAEAKVEAAEAATKLAEKKAEAEKVQQAAQQKLAEAKKAEEEQVKLQAEQKKAKEVLSKAQEKAAKPVAKAAAKVAPAAVVPPAPATKVEQVVVKAAVKDAPKPVKAVAKVAEKAVVKPQEKAAAKVDAKPAAPAKK